MKIPDWYATDVAHCLRLVWRQGISDEQLARAYHAYLAAAPAEPEPRPSEPLGWPSGVAVAWPRQQGRAAAHTRNDRRTTDGH